MKLINARGVGEELQKIQDVFTSYHEEMLKSVALSQIVHNIVKNRKEVKDYNIIATQQGYDIQYQDKKVFNLNEVHDGYTKMLADEDKESGFNVFDLSKVNKKKLDAFLDKASPKWRYLIKKSSHDSFIGFINDDAGMQNYNDIFNEQLNKLSAYAKEHKGEKKAYIYNDLDNFFWQQKNVIKLKSQGLTFSIASKEGIYDITCDYNDAEENEEKPEFNIVFDSNANNPKQLVIKKLMQPYLLYALMLDLEHSVKNYEQDYDIKPTVKDVVKSYDYHLAYMNHNFGLTKEECIWRLAFYCFPLAQGTDEKGNYVYDNRDTFPYQKAVEKKMDTIQETISHSEFTIPVSYQNNKIFKKIKNLNDDWKEFFVDLNALVKDFLPRYEAASKAKKAKMSYATPEELVPELQQLLTITDKLIGKNQAKPKVK